MILLEKSMSLNMSTFRRFLATRRRYSRLILSVSALLDLLDFLGVSKLSLLAWKLIFRSAALLVLKTPFLMLSSPKRRLEALLRLVCRLFSPELSTETMIWDLDMTLILNLSRRLLDVSLMVWDSESSSTWLWVCREASLLSFFFFLSLYGSVNPIKVSGGFRESEGFKGIPTWLW